MSCGVYWYFWPPFDPECLYDLYLFVMRRLRASHNFVDACVCSVVSCSCCKCRFHTLIKTYLELWVYLRSTTKYTSLRSPGAESWICGTMRSGLGPFCWVVSLSSFSVWGSVTEVSFYETLWKMLEYFETIFRGAEPIKKIRKIIDFSGCPPPQWGALGDGYDVPGWRARRLVFNTTVKIRNSCLSSNLIPGQMDTKSVLISAAK